MVRWIAALVLVTGCMGHSGKDDSASNKNEQQSVAEQNEQGQAKPAVFDGTQAAPFDGKRAMGYLKAICDIGPRMSGTEGMRQQQELLKKHFEALGLKVKMQPFEGKQTTKAAVDMSNMIVSFAPEKTRRVILCSHYDTRPIADQEEDQRKWRQRFVSANDGGSGVALLKNMKIDVGVDFVFFDGEEYIWNNKKDVYFLGSKHFAKAWVDNNRKPEYTAAILLDMIGGIDAVFPIEYHSRQKAEKLCDAIWGLARSLKIKSFRMEDGDKVLDDHISLQEVDIPAIDIIDFSYKHWHKLSDTPEQCSAESMSQVATVLSIWIQRVK